MKAASRSRTALVFIVNFWKRAAIQQLPRSPFFIHTHARQAAQGERGRESRAAQSAPSTSVPKMAQHRVMLMCYNTVAIRTSGPWTLSQHLGLCAKPASNISPASHQAAAVEKRKRRPAEALGGGAVQPLQPGFAAAAAATAACLKFRLSEADISCFSPLRRRHVADGPPQARCNDCSC